VEVSDPESEFRLADSWVKCRGLFFFLGLRILTAFRLTAFKVALALIVSDLREEAFDLVDSATSCFFAMVAVTSCAVKFLIA
jgi:hypothetical protein